MKEYISEIKQTLRLIPVLRKKYSLKTNSDASGDLLYCGIANSDIIKEITLDVEEFFGKPYKPAGKSMFFKNFFDLFLKQIGGIKSEQTLFKKQINEQMFMYCAFWPWGSNPVKTSVRVGLVCFGADERNFLIKELKGAF